MSFPRRVERLRERLSELNASSALVTAPVNVRYLTGLASSNAALVVDARNAWLLTDGRYLEAARTVAGVELVEAERELPGDLRKRLSSLVSGPVAVEADRMTVADHATIAEGGVELVPGRKVVEALRAIKDEEELAAIRRAAEIVNEAFERLRLERVVGRSEADVAWWMERAIRELGAEAVSFSPIVAGGPNGALPHHHPGDRVVGTGELLVVDAGAVVDGYCSDCTRTFATGMLPPELERAFEACLDTQRRSLEALAAGRPCEQVDGLARTLLLEHGYEPMHNLGHSVGLEIHEDPRLARGSQATIAVGNVLTVEPGVYLAGRGGVRIEDLVVVGPSGIEVLTPVSKELVTLS